MNIVWDKPYYAIFLLLIPLSVWLFYQLIRWRKVAKKQFADEHLIPALFPTKKIKAWQWAELLLLCAFVLGILALIGPMWGKEKQTLKREGIDLVIALDVSTSMNAEDIAPNRLEKAKNVVRHFLDQLGGDRVGLVIFAGEAMTVSPLTSDYGALKNYLNTLDTQLLYNQGTHTAAALQKATAILKNTNSDSKAIVLISDGEDHETDLDESIEITENQNIKVYTLGIGKEIPVPIPVYENGELIGYKQDNNGNTVLSKLAKNNLINIANETGGAYATIGVTQESVAELMQELGQLKKNSETETETYQHKTQYQWFLGLAIVCFVVFVWRKGD